MPRMSPSLARSLAPSMSPSMASSASTVGVADIITATNSFVTSPIAEAFGVTDLIATEPERIDGRYTGRVAGTPCFQHGKIERLHDWLQTSGMNMEGSWFYSDSHNDLPLLSRVTRPTAVDPDEILEAHARRQGWPVISLR